MSQNMSSAVMSARIEPDDSLDYFPTPPWATRALCEWIGGKVGHAHMKENLTVWEPACGEGHMSFPLSEYFASVIYSDVVDYGIYGQEVADFLQCTPRDADWIITNPPFRLAEQFITLAQMRAKSGVAMLVRTAFLESVGRYEKLFRDTPPTTVLQFSERVPMHKGKLTAKGSTATAYCWVVWRKHGANMTEFEWIGPCRKRLERASDYPGWEDAA